MADENKDDLPLTGEEAAEYAAKHGVNPRTVATSSDPEGTLQGSDQVEPIGESTPDAEGAPEK